MDQWISESCHLNNQEKTLAFFFFFYLKKINSFIFLQYTYRKPVWEEVSWDRPEDYIQTQEFQISKTKCTEDTLFHRALELRTVPTEVRQAPGWLLSSAEELCWSSEVCHLCTYSWWWWTWSCSCWRARCFWPCAAWPSAPRSLCSQCNTAALSSIFLG